MSELRVLRMAAGLTQKELAGDRITRNMLSLIESGNASPSVSTLLYLAERLEVSPACITQYMNGITCPGVAMLVRICHQLGVEDMTEPAECIYFDEARRMMRKLSA